MTLTGGGTNKIYNSADKIFELSTKDPIGIMIYNTLDFMGVPLDVAIKQFRDSPKCLKVSSLEEIAHAFFSFLLLDIGAPEEAQQRRVRDLCIVPFTLIKKDFDEKIEKVILQNPKKFPKDFDPQKIFDESVNRLLIPLSKRPQAKAFEDVSIEQFLALYSDAINLAINQVWDDGFLNEEDRKNLRDLGASIFVKEFVTPSHTGIVIAGFGADDLFPKLVEFKLDGVIAGRLKTMDGKSVLIDRVNTTAEIVPFAQHEMADRFLYGIDPEVEQDIASYLEIPLGKQALRSLRTPILSRKK